MPSDLSASRYVPVEVRKVARAAPKDAQFVPESDVQKRRFGGFGAKKPGPAISVRGDAPRTAKPEFHPNVTISDPLNGARLKTYPPPLARFLFSLGGPDEFYSQLQVYVMAGISFIESINLLRVSAYKSKNKVNFQVFTAMWEVMEGGGTLIDAMKDWFPPTDILLMAGGSKSPKTLPEAIDRIIIMKNGISEAKGAIFAMIFDPLLVLVGTYGMIMWTSTIFYTKVMALVRNVHPLILTGAANQMAAVGRFADSWWVYSPPVIVLLIMYGLFRTFPRWTGKTRRSFDRLPPWSTYKALQGASWMQAFSLLAKTTPAYKDIVDDMAVYASPWLKERLVAISGQMTDLSFGEALAATGYNFPDKKICENMAAIGPRRGFNESLDRLGVKWFQGLIQRLKASGSVMNTLIMLFSTLGMAWSFFATNVLVSQISMILQNQH